jgi:hypothetical protein
VNLARISKSLDGRRVSLALRDGSRIDDSHLISAGRQGARGLWLFTNGVDTFVALEDVVDLWEAAAQCSRAA